LKTTVCDVFARHENFICSRVRLCATFESDCFEHSVRMGDGCKRGLVPTGSDFPGGEALVRAVCGLSSPERPAIEKRAATFTGILRPGSDGPNDLVVLEIEKVEDIRRVNI
jgi:hypothetical protein